MNEHDRSAWACPVCGKHTLALDEPPRIDIMGVQVYSDLVGMGDVTPGGSLGIVCLTCDTRWADKGAFDRNEPGPPEELDAGNDGETLESGFPGDDEDHEGRPPS